MKKRIAIVMVLLLLGSLAACGEKPAVSSDDHSDWVWVRDLPSWGALSDTGYYYARASILHYFDFAANTSVVLCSQAGCPHKGEICDAYMVAQDRRQMYFANDRLYYIDLFDLTLYSRNAIGMDLKKTGTIGTKYIKEQKAVKIGRCAVAGEYLYYEADVTAKITDEEGVVTTKLERACIGRIHLSTGKDEILIEQMYDKQQGQKLILCAARANGVLLNRWEGMEAMDLQDPAYIETSNKIPVTLEHWNGETGESTVLFRKTIKECSGIKMVSGGKVYYKSADGHEAGAGLGYSYDLRTGKEETACPHRVRWYLGGSYVQCTDPEAEKTFIYDMATGQELSYELDGTQSVCSVSDKGYILQLTTDEEILYYYVAKDSLADGLQEADLQFIYALKKGVPYD